jgi:hypothetical protein
VAGYAASDLIDWTDDPAIGATVGSRPARFETRCADAPGLRPVRSFDDIVREYIDGPHTPSQHFPPPDPLPIRAQAHNEA